MSVAVLVLLGIVVGADNCIDSVDNCSDSFFTLALLAVIALTLLPRRTARQEEKPQTPPPTQAPGSGGEPARTEDKPDRAWYEDIDPDSPGDIVYCVGRVWVELLGRLFRR